jgi:hypothetical protein
LYNLKLFSNFERQNLQNTNFGQSFGAGHSGTKTLVKVRTPDTPGRKLWSKFCRQTLRDENFGQSSAAGHSGTKTLVKVRMPDIPEEKHNPIKTIMPMYKEK